VSQVRVLPAAQREIRAAARWYEARHEGLGIEFVALVDEALAKIADRPRASPPWRADRPYRRRLVRRFPYAVFFVADDELVTVVAVAHQRRRPGYWEDR